ncbi:MAG: DNA translocase FtsK 4TM domain-containing protein [Planctomycetota bacterium]
MPKRRKADPDQVPSATAALAAYRGIGWAMVLGVWLIVVAALVSHHPSDAPNHAVGVSAYPTHNWVGAVGATLAYRLYLMLGPGVWACVIGVAVYLYLTATHRKVNQLGLRSIGLVMMTVTLSALAAISARYGVYRSPAPEGPGGLIALFLNDSLIRRFDIMGSVIVLGVSFWVGAILTADKYVLAIPRGIAHLILKACDIDYRRMPLPRLGLANKIKALAEPLRAWFIPRSRVDWDGAETDIEDGPQAEEKTERQKRAERKKKLKVRRSGKPAGSTATALEAMEHVTNTEEDDTTPPPDDDSTSDAPDAYTNGKKDFDPEELKKKMAQMPINFAGPIAAKPAPVQEMDLSGYQFPGIDLLEEPQGDFTAEQEAIVRDQAVQLESAMQQYNIQGEVVGIDSGPVITLFEARLAPGTKAARLSGVATDLARSMKAQNIRIVPNMAGKDTVGIEVPNIKRELVRVKELMSACPESMTQMKLPMYLGKDSSGNPLVQDLNKMPHMLIAGTTGSGKSVCMNSIIMSFLFTKKPDELKLVLVDPKMVEMSMFKNIPHLMCPVVTEMSKAAAILEWAVTKMDERYELLAEVGVRDIGSYNELGWDEIKDRMDPATEDEAARIPKKLPYMVFVIDELADLMMTNKEVESHIVRIAQKARAVGIHLILATQRPSANVVTGLIKSNMPCRICMKVSSGMDSRIVLDQKGGELLLGHGDMLFLSPRSSELIRAQGCLIEDYEVRKTVKFLKTVSQQSFEPSLVQLKSSDQADVDDEAMQDPLFEKAVEIVLETKRGSVSLLQRRLTIGYSRSSRLIEAMAASGILGSHKGSQAREVQITPEEWEAMKQMQADQAAGGTTAPATEEPNAASQPNPEDDMEPPLRYAGQTPAEDDIDADEEAYEVVDEADDVEGSDDLEDETYDALDADEEEAEEGEEGDWEYEYEEVEVDEEDEEIAA